MGAAGADAAAAELVDHERWWGVAMRNRDVIPGYKRFVDRGSGAAPDVSAAFLDVRSRPGRRVGGAVLPVDEAALRCLDQRERNYVRRDVTGLVRPHLGRTATYVGSAEGRGRRDAALAGGRLVVVAGYLRAVRRAFAQQSAEALRAFEASTPAPPCRVVDLERVEL